MSEETLKPFDYAAYLAGAPVRTRDGRKVLELCMAKTYGLVYPLAVWLDGGPGPHLALTAEGRSSVAGLANRSDDLFMETVKKSVWINLYREPGGDFFTATWTTQELADSHAKKYPQKFIKTSEVEYEE